MEQLTISLTKRLSIDDECVVLELVAISLSLTLKFLGYSFFASMLLWLQEVLASKLLCLQEVLASMLLWLQEVLPILSCKRWSVWDSL